MRIAKNVTSKEENRRLNATFDEMIKASASRKPASKSTAKVSKIKAKKKA